DEHGDRRIDSTPMDAPLLDEPVESEEDPEYIVDDEVSYDDAPIDEYWDEDADELDESYDEEVDDELDDPPVEEYEDGGAYEGEWDDVGYDDEHWADEDGWEEEPVPAVASGRLTWWTPRTKRALIYVVLALVSIGVAVRLTPNGLVVGGDSTSYLAITK